MYPAIIAIPAVGSGFEPCALSEILLTSVEMYDRATTQSTLSPSAEGFRITKRAYFIVKIELFAFSRNNSGDRCAEALFVFGVTRGNWVPSPILVEEAGFRVNSGLL